jgi:hypothetical protein
LLWAIAATAQPQTTPDFSGLWKQDNDRCQPGRSGDVTLRIEHREPELTVETTILRGSQPAPHAVQQYTTDGKSPYRLARTVTNSTPQWSGKIRIFPFQSKNTKTGAFFAPPRRGC